MQTVVEQEITGAAFEPVRMLEVEVSQALPCFAGYGDQGQLYRIGRVLVRLHGFPLAILDVPLGEDGIDAASLAAAIWDDLHDAINAHLRQDGLPTIMRLTAAGLPITAQPRCLRERQEFLAHAPFVSLIVCTRDRPESLKKCLQNLLALDYPNYEVLIVDNAPKTSATEDLVRQYEDHVDPPVRYLKEVHPGLSWARNYGLKYAKGEIVAYVDDDEQVDALLLTELARGFDAAPNVACVTGVILPAELETQAQGWFEQFGGHSKGRDFHQTLFNTSDHAVQNPLFPTPPLGAGGNMSFRTAELRKLGGFDVALGAGTAVQGAEDTASFYDVITHGYTLVFQPSAIIRHFHYREYPQLRRQLNGYGIGLTAFMTRALLKNPLRLIDLIRIAPKSLIYMFSPRSPRSLRMQSDYPAELNQVQRQGMLSGPTAYLRSRWHLRAVRQQFGN